MGHTHIKTIKTSRSCNNYERQDKNITDPESPWMLINIHSKKFPEGNKNGNLLTWTGLNNQQLLNHLPPSITTALGNMDQERKNLQSTKQVKSEF